MFNLRPCSFAEVEELCARYHPYGTCGGYAVYNFAVYEEGRFVAVYSWNAASIGTARLVCPEMPQAVLSLSRMSAVPRNERALKHVSKPLREQMKHRIDRGRWPVLVTYSDEGLGHTGYVYQCSGWQAKEKTRRPVYGLDGVRRSVMDGRPLERLGTTVLLRWEHWACPEGAAAEWMSAHGWRRVPRPGRVWRSGNPAYTFVQESV